MNNFNNQTSKFVIVILAHTLYNILQKHSTHITKVDYNNKIEKYVSFHFMSQFQSGMVLPVPLSFL